MPSKLNGKDAADIRIAYAAAPEEKAGSKKYEEMKRLAAIYSVHYRTIENVVTHRSHKVKPSRLAVESKSELVNHVR